MNTPTLRQRLTGLLATVAVLGIVIGLPAAFLAIGANPIPAQPPTLDGIKDALLAPDALKALHAIPVAAKGPTTAAALRARGFRSVDAGLRTVTPRPSHPLAFLALHLMDETPR